jgi:hypothetical protein
MWKRFRALLLRCFSVTRMTDTLLQSFEQRAPKGQRRWM